MATAETWQFVVEAPLGVGTFHSVSGQTLEPAADSFSVALGDINRDGTLDAFIGNNGDANEVWLNDGTGNFTFDDSQTALALETSATWIAALGDLDGDGDLNAFSVNYSQNNNVWINTGGVFALGQELPIINGSKSSGLALGDFDSNGTLDAFVANYQKDNVVWLNDGTGNFTQGNSLENPRGQSKYSYSRGVAARDLNGDRILDVFETNTNSNGPDNVWFGDGSGGFTTTEASLESLEDVGGTNKHGYGQDVALGDLDGDGTLDAFVANYGSTNVGGHNTGCCSIKKAQGPSL